MNVDTALRFRYEAFANYISLLSASDSFEGLVNITKKHAKYFLKSKFYRFAFLIKDHQFIIQSKVENSDTHLYLTPFEIDHLQHGVPKSVDLVEDICADFSKQLPNSLQQVVIIPQPSKKSKLVISVSSDENNKMLVADRTFIGLMSQYFESKLYQMQLTESLLENNKELTLSNRKVLLKTKEISKIIEQQDLTIKERTENLREQNELLKQYASINSHNVRGPLSTILGLLNLCDSLETIDESKEILAMLKVAANKLDDEIKKSNELLSANNHPEMRQL